MEDESNETESEALMTIDELTVGYRSRGVVQDVVNGVSLAIRSGQITAIVGESGSGKSQTLMAALGLLAGSDAVITGRAILGDLDLVSAPEDTVRSHRQRLTGTILQNPLSSLNPVYKIERQLTEAMLPLDDSGTAKSKRERAIHLLELAGLPSAELQLRRFPHQLSGGMRQRVCIAIALANNPRLLVADEPTTALDVTIQAQILDLLKDLVKARGMGMVIVTHDFGVVAEIADIIHVMYAGRIVESGTVEDIFLRPSHPYTSALLRARPSHTAGRGKLNVIQGSPPGPDFDRNVGCSFRPRCDRWRQREVCETTIPANMLLKDSHVAACHFATEAALK